MRWPASGGAQAVVRAADADAALRARAQAEAAALKAKSEADAEAMSVKAKADVTAMQAKAAQEGLPYQSLMTSVLHKYVTGRLVDPDQTPETRKRAAKKNAT